MPEPSTSAEQNPEPAGQLKGKVVVVVGASQGSGRAYVLALARAGAKVVAVARTLSVPGEPDSSSSLEGIARQAGREGFSIDTIACDIKRDAEVHDLVEGIVVRYGRIDAVVVAAGVYPRHDALAISPEDWDHTMNVNVRGPYFVIREVAPHMIEQGAGSITVLTSKSAEPTEHGSPAHVNLMLYGVSKAAVNRMAQWFAAELAPHGIAVNAISPGAALTDNWRRIDPEQYEEFVKAGTGNAATPEVLGPPIVYLAQQSAATLTGQILHTNTFGVTWGPKNP
jgi:NAD(P)-dependent dehydrogenase (short-subunit alcohol dehydrogenase family)